MSYREMIWVSRVLAAVTVIIGPAVLVYGRSDLGPWTPWSENVLLSVPFAFHAFAAFCYVVATGLTRADASTLRTTIAAVGCLLIPFATLALSLPLLFAIGESSNDPAVAIVCAVLALPTATFQVLVTRRRIAVSIVEFLSHPFATGGAVLVSGVLSLPPEQGIADRIFQAWPILLALAPFVALAVVGASAVPLRRLALACVVAAIPIYAAMTILDIKSGRGVEAALWPARVWSDFISDSEHFALVRAVTTIRPNVPVRIGEHWYRFERPGIPYAWPGDVRRPDRIVFVQLDIPADDLDLPEMRITGDHVQLNIATPSLSFGNSGQPPEELERSGTFVAIADRDLIVYIVAPRNRDIDRSEVREKLRRFIRNARVEPPVGAIQR
jgi:hypothetical protein